MHTLVEIVFGLADRSVARVRPRSAGVSLVRVDLPGLTAAELARAARHTLSRPRRTVAAAALPKVQVVLESQGTRRWVADDRTRDMRALKIIPPTGAPMATEADTSSLADDIQLQALLAHVAAAFDVEVAEDLGPDLATAAPRTAVRDASPKEQAILRAHEKLRQHALEIRRIDAEQRAPTAPSSVAIGATAAGVGLLLAAGLFLPASARPWAVTIAALVLIGVIGAWAWRAWGRASSGTSLEAARTRASHAREAARHELTEQAEKLARRGTDPDEVLGRLSSAPIPAALPVIVHLEAFSSADLQTLADLGRPALVFVDRQGLLFADDYAEFLVPLELSGPPTRPTEPGARAPDPLTEAPRA